MYLWSFYCQDSRKAVGRHNCPLKHLGHKPSLSSFPVSGLTSIFFGGFFCFGGGLWIVIFFFFFVLVCWVVVFFLLMASNIS